MQSSINDSKPLIAFFGATGGCCSAALTRSLNAGYTCTALARTPSKLTSMLLSKGVSQSIITANLHIVEGDIRDIKAVKDILSLEGRTANIILSGIGVYTLAKTTICTDAARTILAALAELNPTQKPLVLGISSTGISAGPRDVPLALYPLYKLLLANAHKDKHDMEGVLTAPSAKESSSNIRGAVIVRASILTNGPALGEDMLRVGSEEKPKIGYTVSREDVGQWIFENIIRDENRDRWIGEKVNLTY